MRVVLGALAVGLALVVFSPAAEAEEYGNTTEYNFDDDVVEGDLVRPDGEMALARRRGRQSSLIRVREHFIPEMLKSVEDL
ncbi:MAG: hypothetical protein ACOY3Y_05360 [Acidobacteriota bacterium]